MTVPRKMMLLIGIKRHRRLFSKRGFSFIEVMVTVVILSVGLVSIFQTFIISMDRMSHLTQRIYATHLLDNQIITIERRLRAYQVLPFDFNQVEHVDIGALTVDFVPKINVSAINDFVDVFQLDLTLEWKEGNKQLSLSRSAYISDFEHLIQN